MGGLYAERTSLIYHLNATVERYQPGSQRTVSIRKSNLLRIRMGKRRKVGQVDGCAAPVAHQATKDRLTEHGALASHLVGALCLLW